MLHITMGVQYSTVCILNHLGSLFFLTVGSTEVSLWYGFYKLLICDLKDNCNCLLLNKLVMNILSCTLAQLANDLLCPLSSCFTFRWVTLLTQGLTLSITQIWKNNCMDMCVGFLFPLFFLNQFFPPCFSAFSTFPFSYNGQNSGFCILVKIPPFHCSVE